MAKGNRNYEASSDEAKYSQSSHTPKACKKDCMITFKSNKTETCFCS
uniref:Uncharacterized protein n=1 Tax=Rhizophora mucronata TaxID=61149 RepID=A0A2P2IRN4_RHIMU